MEARSKIGVVIFDRAGSYDPDGENPGYRCLPGGEPVRIYGTGDLPTDIRWLTNINLDVAYASRLQNSPKLLNTNFMRTSVNSVLNELGLKAKEGGSQAYVVARVFDNVMRQAETFFGITEPPMFSLTQAIPSQLGHRPIATSNKVKESSVRAVQSYGQCEVKSSNEAIFTSVVIPRARHAQNILNSGLPFGNWSRLGKADLPLKVDRLEWVNSLDTPTMCRLKINRISKKYNSLINYGAGAGYIDRRGASGANYSVMNDRVYACSNEILFLSDIADISIEEVLICDEPVEQRYAVPSDDKSAALSYSHGLLLENMWSSLDRDAEGKKHRSPMAAWLHAQDRVICLKHAAELHRLGYKILSYGYGRITLALEPNMVKQLTSDCQKLSLIPPLGVSPSDVIVVPERPSGDDLLIGLFAQANLDTIIDIDNQFTEKAAMKRLSNRCANV